MRQLRQHEEDEHINESWLIPYADILTMMLALFVVLFAISQIDQNKFELLSMSFNEAMRGGTGLLEHQSILPEQNLNQSQSDTETEAERRFRLETERLRELQEQVDTYIEENDLSSDLSTVLNYEELKIEIKDKALFASGSAEVTGSSRTLALAISEMLAEYPGYEVVISGHTDNKPINTAQFRSNWDLSAARALNFMKVLLENEDLDPKLFSAVGYGEYRPIADNETAEGRGSKSQS